MSLQVVIPTYLFIKESPKMGFPFIFTAELNLRRKSYLMATTEAATESDDDAIKVENVDSKR
jgi:hypothetical protein